MNLSLPKLPALLFAGILLMLAAVSCKKDPYEIGFNLLPPGDTLHVTTTDTITVEAFSVRQDSVRTDKTSFLTLGSVMDPYFGKTTVGFYSQVRLSSEGVDFGENPVLDSLVLMLFYKGVYGDTLTQQNVRVWEISGDISYDSLYYSNQRLQTWPTLLADQDFVPNVTDSVQVYKEKVPPHLRINLSKLTKYLGNKILEAPEDALASITLFNKFLKGLYVTASPVNNRGALLNFDIANGMSKMVVYFHNGNDPKDDSLSYDLWLNQGCARFLAVDHNGYADASQDLKRQVINRDSAQGKHQLFLQGLGGVKIKLKFPYFEKFAGNNQVAINDAVLQFRNVETDTTYPPPASLTIMRQDSIGRVGYLIDENEGTSYFGGVYNTGSRTYSFRLTQHLQNILQKAYPNKYDLYLMLNSPLASNTAPNRVMLYGTDPKIPGANDENRLRLRVTYTLLNAR